MTDVVDTTPEAEDKRRKRPIWKPLAAAGIGAAVLVGTGFGVFASLQATANNTTAQQVQTGVLSLNLGDNGAGFTQPIRNLAPTDVIHRFVNLRNSGTVEARGLGVAVGADNPSSPLIADAGSRLGLRVTITSCSTAWAATGTAASPAPGGGTCTNGGTPTELLSQRPLAELLKTDGTFVPISTATRAANEVLSLRITLSLPDQTETTVNGTLPPNSIQNAAVALTWTFQQGQRAGIEVNS
jgi:hypothetical protein